MVVLRSICHFFYTSWIVRVIGVVDLIPDFPSAESPSQVSMFPISSSIFVFSISSRSIIHAVAALSLITAPVVGGRPDGDGHHEKRVILHLGVYKLVS